MTSTGKTYVHVFCKILQCQQNLFLSFWSWPTLHDHRNFKFESLTNFPSYFHAQRENEIKYNNTHISRSTTPARAWFNWFFHSFVLGSNACWQCITLETPHLVSLSALRRRLWTKMDIATRIAGSSDCWHSQIGLRLVLPCKWV